MSIEKCRFLNPGRLTNPNSLEEPFEPWVCFIDPSTPGVSNSGLPNASNSLFSSSKIAHNPNAGLNITKYNKKIDDLIKEKNKSKNTLFGTFEDLPIIKGLVEIKKVLNNQEIDIGGKIDSINSIIKNNKKLQKDSNSYCKECIQLISEIKNTLYENYEKQQRNTTLLEPTILEPIFPTQKPNINNVKQTNVSQQIDINNAQQTQTSALVETKFFQTFVTSMERKLDDLIDTAFHNPYQSRHSHDHQSIQFTNDGLPEPEKLVPIYEPRQAKES